MKLCSGVGSFSSLDQQYVNPFEVPQNFIDYSNVADPRPVNVGIPTELLDVVVFGWNGVFTKNQEQLSDPSSIMFGQLLD